MLYNRYFSYWGWREYITAILLGITFYIFVYLSVVLVHYAIDRSRIDQELKSHKEWLHGFGEQSKKEPIKIYAANGKLMGEYLPERGSKITMPVCKQLRPLRDAVIATEDHDFYSHRGISYKSIIRAAWKNISSFGIRQGGGTISQQLARNLFTNMERSFSRKLYESLAAYQIESILSKDEILCLYLNKIYMGEGRVGAEEASWFYFKKPPEKLDIAEAAMIVGLFPSPVKYSPLNNIELSLKKQKMVLDRMTEHGNLSQAKRQKTMKHFLRRYQVKLSTKDSGLIGLYGASRYFRFNIAPSANEYVKDFLHQSLPDDVIRNGGLRVYTTIDPVRQSAALRTIRSMIRRLRIQMILKNPKKDPELMQKYSRRLNGVLISLDSVTGNILSVVGGYSVTEGTMTRRVWSMRRQPGSSLKGFLYAVALNEETLKINSLVDDKRISINGYRPRNWNRKYLGEMPLVQAVAMSVNTIAVQTLHDIGISRFRSYLSSALGFGFFEARKRFPGNLSLALGSGELSPLELAKIYAPISNGGFSVTPRLIRFIESSTGDTLWSTSRYKTSETKVFDPASSSSTLKLMEHVFDPSLNGTASFIGKRREANANYLPFPIAGKTGTVQIDSKVRRTKYKGIRGVRDAWFIGIVPREVTVVWLGQDEGVPIPVSGATAATVWAAYAQSALKGRIQGNFPAYLIDPFDQTLEEENAEDIESMEDSEDEDEYEEEDEGEYEEEDEGDDEDGDEGEYEEEDEDEYEEEDEDEYEEEDEDDDEGRDNKRDDNEGRDNKREDNEGDEGRDNKRDDNEGENYEPKGNNRTQEKGLEEHFLQQDSEQLESL